MKLSLLFLIIASTSFESINLALASGDSERTSALEFGSVPRYVRANSTSEQQDEERMRVMLTNIPKLNNRQMLQRFEKLFPELTEFDSKSIKAFTQKHVNDIMAATVKGEEPSRTRERIFYSLLEPTFLKELQSRHNFVHEKYVDLALYLALLESVGGSVTKAAKQINGAIIREEKHRHAPPHVKAQWAEKKKNGLVLRDTKNIAYDQAAVEILYKMEEGQFLMWRNCLGYLHEVKRNILGKTPFQWHKKVEQRYRRYLFTRDWKKHEIPK